MIPLHWENFCLPNPIEGCITFIKSPLLHHPSTTMMIMWLGGSLRHMNMNYMYSKIWKSFTWCRSTDFVWIPCHFGTFGKFARAIIDLLDIGPPCCILLSFLCVLPHIMIGVRFCPFCALITFFKIRIKAEVKVKKKVKNLVS